MPQGEEDLCPRGRETHPLSLQINYDHAPTILCGYGGVHKVSEKCVGREQREMGREQREEENAHLVSRSSINSVSHLDVIRARRGLLSTVLLAHEAPCEAQDTSGQVLYHVCRLRGCLR